MKKSVKRKTVVGIADMATTDKTDELLVTYSLGSCLGVIVYDYKNKVAAMLHAMLPTASLEKISRDSITFNPYKYVDTGVDALLKKLYKMGAEKKSMSVNVFGGSKIFDREDYFNIGKRNYVAFRKSIWKHGLFIDNEHIGGIVHRTVKLSTKTGRIKLDVNKEKVLLYNLNK